MVGCLRVEELSWRGGRAWAPMFYTRARTGTRTSLSRVNSSRKVARRGCAAAAAFARVMTASVRLNTVPMARRVEIDADSGVVKVDGRCEQDCARGRSGRTRPAWPVGRTHAMSPSRSSSPSRAR